MNMKETDLIRDLPSYKFYIRFDNDKSHTGYSIDCNNISTDPSEQKILSTICTKLSKNIYDLENDVTQDQSFFNKHCYDLNYWLYNQVYSALSNGEMKNRINSVFEELHKRWKNINHGKETNKNNKICMPESKIFKTGLYEPMKELLDYFENFQRFEQEMKTRSEEANKYCEYILKHVPLYFTFQELCTQMPNENCSKYMENSKQYDPSKILSNLLCVKEEKYKVELDENLIKEMIKTYQPGASMLFSGLDFPGFGFPGNFQSMFMNNIFDLIQKGFGENGIQTIFDKIPYFSNIFNYDIMQKYVMPTLYGLGGLIFFFVLYKCCGCLPCCCIFKRRKKRHKRLSDLDASGLMNTPLGFPSPMMPINPYGLRYQPF